MPSCILAPPLQQNRITGSLLFVARSKASVILSPIASEETPRYKGLELTCEEDADLRIFGKPTTRLNRRMGVVVCNAPNDGNLDEVRDKAKRLASYVEVF